MRQKRKNEGKHNLNETKTSQSSVEPQPKTPITVTDKHVDDQDLVATNRSAAETVERDTKPILYERCKGTVEQHFQLELTKYAENVAPNRMQYDAHGKVEEVSCGRRAYDVVWWANGVRTQ